MDSRQSDNANNDGLAAETVTPACALTGIEGLDVVLGGGLPRDRAYLVQGMHGAGKTTLSLQFCKAGAKRGERSLYLTTTESVEEVEQIAGSHGWSLDGVVVHYLDVRDVLGLEKPQSVFYPVEVELPRTVEALFAVIDQVAPQRLVIDSLSELRLLAADPVWFRRQLLALKDTLLGRRCTTLLCDDSRASDQPVQSIVHGVIELEQVAADYGPDRRRLRVAKLRGRQYSSGYHDFTIRTGGMEVYPRLVAAENRCVSENAVFSTGMVALDNMLGGGLDRGAATLLLGPAGTGKSLVISQIAVAAAQRGERCAIYVFDERLQTMLQRATGVGIDLQRHVDEGTVEIQQVDPAEMTPGQFSHGVREATEQRGVSMVMIDSLAGYVHAMPNERLLALYLHELLAQLNQGGITVLLVMAQHGVPGTPREAPFDLSYIADSVLLFHMFEYGGELRKAISVYKRRCGSHEQFLRELRIGREGICIGDPLRSFQSVLSGTPVFVGGDLPDG